MGSFLYTSDFLKCSNRLEALSKFAVDAFRAARLFCHIYQKNDFAFTKQLCSGFILRHRFMVRSPIPHKTCSIVIRKIFVRGFSKKAVSRKCLTAQGFGQCRHLNCGRWAIGNVRERCHEHPRPLSTHTDTLLRAASWTCTRSADIGPPRLESTCRTYHRRSASAARPSLARSRKEVAVPATRVGAATKGDRDGEVGNIYHLFEKKGGAPSDKSAVDPFPVVKWVSLKDGRTEDDGMEDKAAKFIQNQNTLLVNADFRVFNDMIARLCREKDTGIGPDLQSTVEEVVHQWFEQALVETVIGVQQMRGSKEWGPEEIERALSSEALTSAVMQRYHVYIACRRDLGAKFGKFSASG